ncbi:peptidoglycan DD-metalloendopeptidase family protein [Thauera sp. CAU 1555]|uniref:Peptidoglycan DD-metalloendopeptidase family protein n=1 Tax=Thauera sedimentorum TaxID=2767595 RepID=A0ABR9BE80_9RHOO|nr:peptidoglycan DD-metalloendopeptidase family protein [Thauera sedimentorum]MBC9073739.1 peptidoglycan DD-metalloendopeptidase family protein [Thauera sedimentorum]MBD8504658.1 peptidoglycan DD-metalloendopeptidase family protein [Thauera sedimentorum]
MQARKKRILADLLAHLPSARRGWVLAPLFGISLFGVVAATATTPDSPPPFPLQTVVERLPVAPTAADAGSGLPFVHDERVLPGDTIESIFRRLNVSDPEALAFLLGTDEGRTALRQLRSGRAVTALVEPDGRLRALSLPITQASGRFSIERTAEGLQIRGEETQALATVVEMRSGVIQHSLFGATDAAGLPDSVATKLAEIFGTEINFHTDLRRGDSFSVVYETLYDQGSPSRTGKILAAEFVNRGERHVVVLFRGDDGREQYYTADGRSLRQAFLRSPLEFSRVTSGFGRRLHPIHRNWRTHAGVDFAAPIGTPIKATSDGTVSFVGTQRGYGNIIIVQHRDRYSTAYAHLNGFARGLRKGQRVNQGDVIGYVGKTGWATGPHLHYEIRVNNVPHDPMRIALPAAQPLTKGELAKFNEQTSPLVARIALLNRSTVAALR